jgi:serine/threonine protein kinase
MSIEDNAFSNTTIESLILYQNNVVTMSSRAFEKSTDRSSSCVDFEAWSMNDTLLNRSFTCENFASKSYFSYRQSLTTPGSCGYNYLRACCSGGGGHVYGRNIGMDFHSSVTCRVVDGDANIRCGCGILNWRFDTSRNECMAFCPPGRKWQANDDELNFDDTSSGRCVLCEHGKKSQSSDFATSCETCEAGRFSPSLGSSICNQCSRNSYSDFNGASSCQECPFGRHTASQYGSKYCSACDWIYVGSPSCDVPVLGSIILFMTIVITIVLIVFGVRHMRSLKGKLKSSLAELESYSEDVKLLAAAWELQWNQIKLGPQIARGGGGVVHQGELSGIPVAVKLITITDSKHVGDIFEDPEIKWMQRARHPRLVLFFGAGRADTGEVFYVMELMREGTLTQAFLKARENDSSLSWCERLGLLTDVAEGMQYLHLCMGSIHRDLKGQNVLLCRGERRRRAKVADFGLSRIVDRGRHSRKTSHAIKSVSSSSIVVESSKVEDTGEHRLTSFSGGSMVSAFSSSESNGSSTFTSSSSGPRFELSSAEGTFWFTFSTLRNISDTKHTTQSHAFTQTGTVQYMAPELLEAMKSSRVEYTFKADVYAFGMMMHEVLSHEKAWHQYQWTHQIFMIVMSGKRLPIRVFPKSDSVPQGYQSLLERCWSQQPDDRPNFTFILNALRDMMVFKCRSKMSSPEEEDDDGDSMHHHDHNISSDYLRLMED